MPEQQKEFSKMDDNERKKRIVEIRERLEKYKQHENYPNIFVEGLNCNVEKPFITTFKDNAHKDVEFLLLEIERLNIVLSMVRNS